MKKLLLTAGILLGIVSAQAQTPKQMSYQSVIRNSSGALLQNQNVALRISIIQSSAFGPVVYSERLTGITNSNGLVSLVIGTGTVLSGDFTTINWSTGNYYLKTETDPAGGTNYSIAGTSQLLSVPYAFYSDLSGESAGISGTANTIPKFITVNTLGDSQIKDDGTSVSIGIIDSTLGKLDVRGSASNNFATIFGYSSSAQACLKGGVAGYYNSANYGTGVQGIGYNGVSNPDVNAIFGTGNQDLGVYGSANTAGVMGASVAGIGVVGYNKNSSFAATTGIGNTYGIYGNSQTVGGATVPGTRYGIYGFASGAATNYAGYFSGNVQVTGSIAKGSGTFKIDHPLDPENKYLNHSFVESPDMMNIYNGNIVTDTSGNATVMLPDYFEALNMDFRYQLTVIGTFAQAIVAEEITNNSFTIKTDQPNVKVSWQVTGVRHDKYAEAHRVVPEVEKEPEFKGRYLHAAEWGKDASLNIDELTRPKTEISKETKTLILLESPGKTGK